MIVLLIDREKGFYGIYVGGVWMIIFCVKKRG